jgi:hypothetical protein
VGTGKGCLGEKNSIILEGDLMKSKSILGLLVDLEELKKTPNLVLWGRFIRSNGTISPHLKLLEVPIDWDVVSPDKEVLLFDTYITFE